MYKLMSNIGKDSKEMRSYFSGKLTELARNNADVVFLGADLLGTISMGGFLKEFPERGLNVGIAEANMIGIAAGMSVTGKIPFVYSFAPFVTRRVFDQVFLSCAYAKANVKIIGSDPGVTAAFNGGTHMPFEDVGIMRTVPEMTIIEPTDGVMLEWALEEAAKNYGNYYIRILRKGCLKIYEDGSKFEMGKANKIREGSDVTLIASGIMVAEALKAAEMLADKGISARVLDMFTIKPIDAEAIIAAAAETGAIVSCENHNVIGGLGSAISEVLVQNTTCPVEMVGIKDVFGEVGPENYLRERFNLMPSDIVLAAEKVIRRKK